MRILIASATTFEIKPSLPFLKKKGVPVVITGVGCPVSVYAIMKAIRLYQPALIIQAGIAGSFDKNVALGEVMAVSEDYFGDIGVMEHKQWQSVFDMGFAEPGRRPFKNGRLKNPHKTILKNSGLKKAPAVTINEISTNKTRINLFKQSGVVLESMEGAALHYVALMEKIPFLQVRSISNYVGDRNKDKWKIKEAIGNLSTGLQRMVNGFQDL